MVQLSPCKGIPRMQSQLPGGTESTCIVALSVLCWGQLDRGGSCIVLQSGLTRSLIAKFPQHSVFACSTRISCCRERTLQQGHKWVCANLWCLMSWHPKCIRTITAIQLTYLRIHTNLTWLRRGPRKTINCQNWGAWVWTLVGDNTV